ncbi:MAG: SurA N-terminal domain-containing protein [Nitrospirales bacterium]|nr:SurA N-terminal domain-containing protein [Nitrospira sp.]MDR4502040.1 SurA N-terminal domain-containing protein [Nitrospirales bacterium]
MLRTMREGSEKHPWILWAILIAITVTFVIVGAWDYEGNPTNTVAEVGPYTVSLQEFRRTYDNYDRFYRDQLKQEDIQEEQIKQLALNALIDAKAWTLLADEWELEISEEELRNSILEQREFQKDGTFDPQFYQRILANNRMTPGEFESQRRIELRRDKARLLVTESTTLTPEELKEVDELAKRQAKEGEEPDPQTKERIRLQFLLQKKQRALQAFQTALRSQNNIVIHDHLL